MGRRPVPRDQTEGWLASDVGRDDPPSVSDVPANREVALADPESLLRSAEDLAVCLRATTATYQKALEALASGMGVAPVLREVGAGDTRQRLTAALAEFEQRRHVSRLSLVAAELDEGSTIHDISRTWGISRQLASRYVNGIRSEA